MITTTPNEGKKNIKSFLSYPLQIQSKPINKKIIVSQQANPLNKLLENEEINNFELDKSVDSNNTNSNATNNINQNEANDQKKKKFIMIPISKKNTMLKSIHSDKDFSSIKNNICSYINGKNIEENYSVNLTNCKQMNIKSSKNNYSEDSLTNNTKDIIIKSQNQNKDKKHYMEISEQVTDNKFLQNDKDFKNLLYYSTRELNTNSFELILEFSKYQFENEKLKKNLIMQQILTTDMKKELESLIKDKNSSEINNFDNLSMKYNELKNLNEKQKNDCLKIEKELKLIQSQNDDLKKENETLIKENVKINKNFEKQNSLIIELNKIIETQKMENNSINKILHEKNIEILNYSNEIEKLKENNKFSDPNNDDIENECNNELPLNLDNYKNLINDYKIKIQELEKNNEILSKKIEDLLENERNYKLNYENEISDLNQKLLLQNNNSNKELNENSFIEQIDKLNNNIKKKELELYSIKINENNINKIIDNTYDLIKDFSTNIQNMKILKIENSQKNSIIINSLKEFLLHIKTENNGNIEVIEKLRNINEFINIISMELELIFENYKQEKLKTNVYINNTISTSPNGQNNPTFRTNSNSNKKIYNAKNQKFIFNDLLSDRQMKNLNINNNSNISSYINIVDTKNYIQKDKSNENIVYQKNKIDNSNNKFIYDFSTNNSGKNYFFTSINEQQKKENKFNTHNLNDDFYFDNTSNSKKNNEISIRVLELTELIKKDKCLSSKSVNENSRNFNVNSEKSKNKFLFSNTLNNTKILKTEENNKANTNSNTLSYQDFDFNINNKPSSFQKSNKSLLTFNNKSNKNILFDTNNIHQSTTFQDNNNTLNNSNNQKDSSNFFKNKYHKLDIINKKLSYNSGYLNEDKNGIISDANIIPNSRPADSNKIKNHNFEASSLIKIGDNKSLPSLEITKSNYNCKKKFFQKINVNPRKLNGLANEVLRPTFLKSNASISMTMNNEQGNGFNFKHNKNKNLLNESNRELTETNIIRRSPITFNELHRNKSFLY